MGGWPAHSKAQGSDVWPNPRRLSLTCLHRMTRQSPCRPTTGAANTLGDLFAQEFLDLDTRDHGDGVPGAFLGANGTASANVPINNDHLMRAVTGVIRIVNFIDTIDGTKVYAPLTPGAPIDVNPGFWPRSTRALRSLRHNAPATFLAHTYYAEMCTKVLTSSGHAYQPRSYHLSMSFSHRDCFFAIGILIMHRICRTIYAHIILLHNVSSVR